MSSEKQQSSPQFRPEIQGVRAVASLLVAVYHVWLGRVSGGVDVFFVVSGFLITTSLLKQIESDGRVQFVVFWGRLIKRLLPVAVLVLGVVLVASLLWLPRYRWDATAREILASALYLENWQLAETAVDYLDREDALSPVQHYWALSTQGQFYLLWPLLLSVVAWVASRSQRSVRTVLAGMLGLTFCGSLAFSIYATAVNQPYTYFNSLARIWEFSMGGILVLAIPRLNFSRTLRFVLGWLGTLLILSCGLILQVSTIFPGYAALWPTVGAALVLLAGIDAHKCSSGRLLGSKPLAALGDISYSFYLWHWPVLVFYRELTGSHELGLLEGSLILGFSLVLAVVSTRWVEDPARKSHYGKKKPGHALLFGLACVLPLLCVTGAWAVYIEISSKQESGQTNHDRDYPGAASMAPGAETGPRADVPIIPSPLRAKKDLPDVYRDGCHQTLEDSELLSCTYGAEDAKKTMVLVGGSHSAQWLPALQMIAAEYRWRIVTYTKSSCLLTATEPAPNVRMACLEWNELLIKKLVSEKPDLVVTTATRSTQKEVVWPSFVARWRDLEKVGIPVLAIRDNPWFGFNVPECVEKNGPQSPQCQRARREVLANEPPWLNLADPPKNVHFVDLTDFFCDQTTCFSVIGNVLVYRDKHHFTTAFMRTLTPYLEQHMFDGFIKP